MDGLTHLRILPPHWRLLLLLALPVLGACQPAPPNPAINVAAASSLTATLKELGAAFARQGGAPVVVIPGATGSLAQQLRNGAPFDLFLSADQRHVDQLIQQGLMAADSRLPFAQGELVLALPPEATTGIAGLGDLGRLGGPLAIANPDHAPYGAAARQALQNAGLWQDLQARLIFAETVRQAAMMVQSGNASAGLIARSTALESGLRPIPLARAEYDPIVHVGAVSNRRQLHPQAGRFLRFLASREGQRILRAHGFRPLEGEVQP